MRRLVLYPVKSCRGQEVSSWPIGAHGFLYDRHWAVCDLKGTPLNQKKLPKLTAIQPFIDLDAGIITLSAAGHHDISLPLNGTDAIDSHEPPSATQSSAQRWFQAVLDRPCILKRVDDQGSQVDPEHRNFVNSAPFLIVSEASVAAVNEAIAVRQACNATHHEDPEFDASVFRPNIVAGTSESRVSSLAPFDEDRWQRLRIGGLPFEVVGPCARCRLVNIDQRSGVDNTMGEPLFSLSKLRRKGANIFFGVYVTSPVCSLPSGVPIPTTLTSSCWLSVGDRIVVLGRT